jgi:hypothetical protein
VHPWDDGGGESFHGRRLSLPCSRSCSPAAVGLLGLLRPYRGAPPHRGAPPTPNRGGPSSPAWHDEQSVVGAPGCASRSSDEVATRSWRGCSGRRLRTQRREHQGAATGVASAKRDGVRRAGELPRRRATVESSFAAIESSSAAADSASAAASPIRRSMTPTSGGAPARRIPVLCGGEARRGSPARTDPQPVLVGVSPPRRSRPLPCSGTGALPPSSPALCPHLDLAGEKGQAQRGHAGSLASSTGDDGVVQPGARASLEPWGTGRSRLLIRRREPRLLASAGCFLQNGHPSDAS